jgi:four helix bundle protein
MQDVGLQCAAETCRLVGSLPNHLRSQQDQAVRASARIPLAIAEGAGRQGRDRRHLWRVAYGTARETTAVVELLVGPLSRPERRPIEQAQDVATRRSQRHGLPWRRPVPLQMAFRQSIAGLGS